VWLAHNVMGVLRAVKVVERSQFKNDRPYEREFEGIQRYEPVSRSADGLVHVLHVGRNDAEGYFYYVMELADDAGKSQDEKARDDAPSAIPPAHYTPRTLRSDLKRLGRLPLADCLRVALDVVSGLARLHERSLVHRDVKPGNIIFVEGRAKLADIGLISIGGEARTFVGTEGYIAPEGPGTSGADLYALGMVLYEAATGHTPDQFPKTPPEWFAEEARPEVLEFHEIVLKACEGGKERRYQSAEEMHADLALLQSGQSVRHLRALERRMKRWRQISWAAGVVVALAVATALVANWRTKVAADSRAKEAKLLEQTRKSLVRAESAEGESRQQLYTSLLEQARATVLSGELGQRVRALDAIGRAAAISNSVELRREVVAALTLPDLRFERKLPFGAGFTVEQMDPTFQYIALGRGRGDIEIHATSDDHVVATLPASSNRPAYNARWSGDGRFLCVKRDHDQPGSRADLEVWELPKGRRVLLVRDLRWNAWALHPCRPQLLTCGIDGSIVVWDLQHQTELARRKSEDMPELLVYSPDGSRVGAVCERSDGWGVSIHAAADWATLASHVFAERIWSFDWHPDGRWIAASDGGGNIHRMDALTTETRVLGQHKAEAVTTAFSPDGAYLVTGGWERELICWNVSRMQRAFTIGLDSYTLQFQSDGSHCAILTPSAMRLYAFERPAAHREFAEDLGSRLWRATISSDGRWLAASADKRTAVWDLSVNGPAAFLDEAVETRCYFTPDGLELFGSGRRSKDGDDDCFRWRVVPGAGAAAPPGLEHLPLQRPEGFTSLSLVSNSVVFTATNGSVLVPQEAIESSWAPWVRTSPGINEVSPDGRWLAICRHYSDSLYLYHLPELENVARLIHPASISGFEFSPLGDELAVGSRWGTEFYSTATWERTRTLTNCAAVLYTPDSRGIWLVGDQRSTGLYDAHSLEPLLMLPAGRHPLALSSDARRLAVSVDARRLELWDLPALRAELVKLGLDW
jgi:WD40 repeat protein